MTCNAKINSYGAKIFFAIWAVMRSASVILIPIYFAFANAQMYDPTTAVKYMIPILFFTSFIFGIIGKDNFSEYSPLKVAFYIELILAAVIFVTTVIMCCVAVDTCGALITGCE